ncbi:hypothetical protein H8A99_45095, partial [Bradyrhizobium sp. Arg68]|uniref:DUF5801 repeats-in-toxin domain-containing protein n=1 Tax=Bradyrhizobium ivorense TaxID=2511166 RepID=UPI001E3C9C5F
NLITLTATVTDGDFDTNQATLNIGQSLTFKDDGPSISLSGVPVSLTVDETVLATNDTKSFAGAFTPVFGADGPLDANHDGIADAGAVTYALGVVAGASGLVDTLTGQNVILSLVAGHVEGRTAVSNDLVFTVTVDAAGNVTLDQLRAVVHPNAANPDDSTTLSAANLITLTATVTDGDLDTNQATLNIGQSLTFKDDGPSISLSGVPVSLTVDETVLATNDTKSFAAAFTPVFGADGPLDANHDGIADAGAVTYALGVVAGASGLVDTLTGQNVILSLVAGHVEGRTAVSNDLVFTVTVDAAGNVTLDQLRAVVHPNPADPNDSTTLSAANLITLTATVTDGDLDTNQATLNIGQSLTFLDDGPSISLSGRTPSLTVDETVLATNDTKSFAAAF